MNGRQIGKGTPGDGYVKNLFAVAMAFAANWCALFFAVAIAFGERDLVRMFFFGVFAIPNAALALEFFRLAREAQRDRYGL